jgi:hypothetical protein
MELSISLPTPCHFNIITPSILGTHVQKQLLTDDLTRLQGFLDSSSFIDVTAADRVLLSVAETMTCRMRQDEVPLPIKPAPKGGRAQSAANFPGFVCLFSFQGQKNAVKPDDESETFCVRNRMCLCSRHFTAGLDNLITTLELVQPPITSSQGHREPGFFSACPLNKG